MATVACFLAQVCAGTAGHMFLLGSLILGYLGWVWTDSKKGILLGVGLAISCGIVLALLSFGLWQLGGPACEMLH